eukprot:997701-Alexandrium_andersonii.AAC.1
MSASLVGSEMCIRDRPAHRRPPGWLVGRPCALWSAGGRPVRRGHWRRSVSYTHLTLPTICSV